MGILKVAAVILVPAIILAAIVIGILKLKKKFEEEVQGLADPVDSEDSVTRAYVDSQFDPSNVEYAIKYEIVASKPAKAASKKKVSKSEVRAKAGKKKTSKKASKKTSAKKVTKKKQ